MKHVLFLDVDNTLLMNEYNEQGQRKKVLNYSLLQELKALNVRDIYLFSNMNLDEIQDLDNPNRITRKALVHELEKQGFQVHGVITPADRKLKQGIGAAYDSLYLPAFEKKLKNQDYQQEKTRFNDCMPELEFGLKPVGHAAAQKKDMFTYFLENKPHDLKSIIYIDDDSNCLEEVKDAGKEEKNLRIATFQVQPESLHFGAVADEKTKYLNKSTCFFLSEYIHLRTEEQATNNKQYNSFWAGVFSSGRGADTKILAAQKCIKLLQGEQVSFSEQEFQSFTNGRLKKLVNNNTSLAHIIEQLRTEKNLYANGR